MPVPLQKDTKFSKFMARLEARGACQEGIEWLNKIQPDNWAAAIKATQTDPEFEPGWGVWILKTFMADMTPEHRLKLIEEIADPSMALSVYRTLRLPADEDAAIIAKFTGKMPTVEAEIKEGKIARVDN